MGDNRIGTTDIHQRLIRALVAAQIAVLDHAEKPDDEKLMHKIALLECLKEAAALGKGLR